MTRDEIEKLSDEELNVKVATEVMGQTDFSHPGIFWEEGTTEDGQDGWDGWYCPRCHAYRGDTGKCVKKYASNIAAAMQVVEKSEHFELIRHNSNAVGVPGYVKYEADIAIGESFLCSAEADTAPLAICRAALLAKMQP